MKELSRCRKHGRVAHGTSGGAWPRWRDVVLDAGSMIESVLQGVLGWRQHEEAGCGRGGGGREIAEGDGSNGDSAREGEKGEGESKREVWIPVMV